MLPPGPGKFEPSGSPGNNDSSPGTSGILTFFNVVNTLSHFLLGGVTIVSILFIANGTYNAHYTQHVILCCLGYQMLMAQAILAFDKSNGWSNGLKYKDKKIAHWVVQIAGSALAIVGTAIRIQALGFYITLHGILGLVAMILTAVTLVHGVLNLFSSELRLNSRFMKVTHALLGSATLAIASASLCYAFDKNAFRNRMGDAGAVLMIVLTAVGTAATLISACETMYKKTFK